MNAKLIFKYIELKYNYINIIIRDNICLHSSKEDLITYKFTSNWQRCAKVLQILSYIRTSANIRAKVLQICIVAKMNLQWLPIPSTKFT